MDPVTLDICWTRLVGVVNEPPAALMRTSSAEGDPAPRACDRVEGDAR